MAVNTRVNLTITTPMKTVFEGSIDSLVVRTNEGDIGIHKSHQPSVLLLKDGNIKVYAEDAITEYFVKNGTVLIQPNDVTILASFASLPEDVERLQAEYVKELEQSYMQEQRFDLDIQQAELALHRSLTQRGKGQIDPTIL